MDDRLILGIPDASEANAPKSRFATSEMRQRSRRLALLPIMTLAWTALLMRLVSADEKDQPGMQEGHDQSRSGGNEADRPNTDDGHTPRHLSSDPVLDRGSRVVISSFVGDRTAEPVDPSRFAFHRTASHIRGFSNDNHTRHLIGTEDHGTGYGGHAEGHLMSPRLDTGHVSGRSATYATGGEEGKAGPAANGKPATGKADTKAADAKINPAKVTPDKRSNHTPVVAGPVLMSAGMLNQSILVTVAELLTGATDADGDPLTVHALSANSGTLKDVGFGMWLYTPALTEPGAVSFHYGVSDGTDTVMQTANLDLLRSPAHSITGTAGDDLLPGTPGDDVMDGGAGHDVLYGREGNDVIYGGDGSDRLIGGDGNDDLFGGHGDDILFGGLGNDTLFGDDGNDFLYGDDGNDLLFGGDGDDTLSGGTGQDQLHGEAGNDVLDGDAGNDVLLGGAGDDTLSGDGGNDQLVGGSGNDYIDGGAGDDAIDAGDGNDTIVAGSGNDHVDAGAGDDTIHLSHAVGLTVINGGTGTDQLDLSDFSQDSVVDLVNGWAAVDGVDVAQFFDIENVRGGAGNDRLVANGHVNILIGGAGHDSFTFTNIDALHNDGTLCDRISDFSAGDRIDLSRLGASIENFADHKMFFSGLATATPSEIGEIHYEHRLLAEDVEVTVVTGHLAADDSKDFGLILDGHHDLTANDFLLAARAIESGA